MFYKDQDGRLRHPRQNGKNILRKDAEKLGWVPVKREGKHRYLFILEKKKKRETLLKKLKLKIQEYPKVKA